MSIGQRRTKEEFIIEAIRVHREIYCYDEVNYINTDTKIIIICLIHGKFLKTPYHHLQRKQGCPECQKEKLSRKLAKTTEEFIKDAIKIHKDSYNYNEVVYFNNETKVTIICPEHGKFKQKPIVHLRGSGCPACGRRKISEGQKLTPTELKEIHISLLKSNIYFNPKNYTAEQDILEAYCLICANNWKTYLDSLIHNHGCPNCKKSYGEKVVRFVLETLLKTSFPSIRFNMYGRRLEIDCYSKQLGLGIEVQGIQHYKPVKFGGIAWEKAQENFRNVQETDALKPKYFNEEIHEKLIHIDNTVHNRSFIERIELVKISLKENNIYFEDIEITEEMFHQKNLKNVQGTNQSFFINSFT